MDTQSWIDVFVEQVSSGYKFKVYRDQGLDVSNLSQVNEWLVRDGFKPLEEAQYQALINSHEGY
jgi:hypothetical protein